ncbi:MAG: ComF family protein [Patescibacteria group bacterium]|jgi:ComF family protein
MSLKSFLLDLIFPIECLGCRQEGSWLCAACFKKLKFNDSYKKYNLVIPDLNEVFIVGNYDDPLLATTIKKFKYDFILALGPILARFLIMFWQGIISTQSTLLFHKNKSGEELVPLLIPIPLSKKRERWRGFNQTEILAREFSAAFGYPLNLQLKRLKHRSPQAKLNENERSQNIQEVFVWTGEDLINQIIILIDDVVTTGATLNEAARTLRAAGATKVYGLVLAKG